MDGKMQHVPFALVLMYFGVFLRHLVGECEADNL